MKSKKRKPTPAQVKVTMLAATKARRLLRTARNAAVATPGMMLRLDDEALYDLVHAVTADVLEGVQSGANLAKYLPKAAKAAARVIRNKGH